MYIQKRCWNWSCGEFGIRELCECYLSSCSVDWTKQSLGKSLQYSYLFYMHWIGCSAGLLIAKIILECAMVAG